LDYILIIKIGVVLIFGFVYNRAIFRNGAVPDYNGRAIKRSESPKQFWTLIAVINIVWFGLAGYTFVIKDLIEGSAQ